jgi:hypothetical protein
MDHLDPTLREIWLMVLEEIEQQREIVVTKTEFNELKEIVRDLAAAQKRTEQRMGELAAAQQRTEQRVEELAQAQKRTEQRMEELANAQTQSQLEIAKLGREMQITRSQIGGLARTMAYALENEAYRQLPALLKTRAGLHFKERLIRTVIGGEEINFFAKAERDGQAVLVVGESVLKLDDVSKLKQVEQHVELVRQMLTEPVIPLIVTHFAHPVVLEKAYSKGIIVVQSFEWDEF